MRKCGDAKLWLVGVDFGDVKELGIGNKVYGDFAATEFSHISNDLFQCTSRNKDTGPKL